MPNKFILIVFLITMNTLLFSKEADNYHYINTVECKIPIKKYLIEDKTYPLSRSFFVGYNKNNNLTNLLIGDIRAEGIDAFKSIDATTRKHSRLMDTIKKNGYIANYYEDYDFKKHERRRNYILMKFKKISIFAVNYDKEEIQHIMEYCRDTQTSDTSKKKKSNLKQLTKNTLALSMKADNYNYIDTIECKIPIKKYLKDKSSALTWSSFSGYNKNNNVSTLRISEKSAKEMKTFRTLETMASGKYGRLMDTIEIDGYVAKYYEDYDFKIYDWGRNYISIEFKKILLFATNYDKEEILHIMEYCRDTRTLGTDDNPLPTKKSNLKKSTNRLH